MKTTRIVENTIDLHFKGITLLSKEEYLSLKDNIPVWIKEWWLRDPGESKGSVATVINGEVSDSEYDAATIRMVLVGPRMIRPALVMSNAAECGLQIGDKIMFNGNSFTVISNTYALSDKGIPYSGPFAKDPEHIAHYNSSTVQIFLRGWLGAGIAENNKRYDDFVFIKDSFSDSTNIPFSAFAKDDNYHIVQIYDLSLISDADDIVGFAGQFRWENNKITSLDGDSYNPDMTIWGYEIFRDDDGNTCLTVLSNDW